MIKSILAWFSGLFTKGTTMADETNTDVGATASIAADADSTVVVMKEAVPEPDLIAKLETILSALGHELPVFWDEAVALAKKAL
jgi:hypothetical protein